MFSRSPSDKGTQSSTKPALAEPGRCAAKCCEIGVPGIRRSPCSATSVPANLPPPLAMLLKKKKKKERQKLVACPHLGAGDPGPHKATGCRAQPKSFPEGFGSTAAGGTVRSGLCTALRTRGRGAEHEKEGSESTGYCPTSCSMQGIKDRGDPGRLVSSR